MRSAIPRSAPEVPLAAARDAATFSPASGLTFSYGDMDKAGLSEVRPLVVLDPPEHTRFRRIVARGFTPRAVATIEPEVRAFVVAGVERLRDLGHPWRSGRSPWRSVPAGLYG